MRITFLLSILLYASVLSAQVLQPSQGGTGTSVPPTVGQVLVGQSDGTYLPSSAGSGDVLLSPSASQIIAQPLGTTLSSTNTNNVFSADGYASQSATWGGAYSSGTYAKWAVVTNSGNTYMSLASGNTANLATSSNVCTLNVPASGGTCYWVQFDAAQTINSSALPTSYDLALYDALAYIQTSNSNAVVSYGAAPASGSSYYTTCTGIVVGKVANRSVSIIGEGSGGINAATSIHVNGNCSINRAVLYVPPSDNNNDYASIIVSGLTFFVGGGRASTCVTINGTQHSIFANLYCSGTFSDANGEDAEFLVGPTSATGSNNYEDSFNNIKLQGFPSEPGTYATATWSSSLITNTVITGSGGTATLSSASTPTSGTVVFIGGLTAGACLNNAGSVNGNGYTVGTVVSNVSFQVTAPVACSSVSSSDSGLGTVYTISGGSSGAGYIASPAPVAFLELTSGGGVTPFQTMPTGLTCNVVSGAITYCGNTTAPISNVSVSGALQISNNSIVPYGFDFSFITDFHKLNLNVQGALNGCSIINREGPSDEDHSHVYSGQWHSFCDFGYVNYTAPQVDTPLGPAFYSKGPGTTITGAMFSNPGTHPNGVDFLWSTGSTMTVLGSVSYTGTSASGTNHIKDATDIFAFGQPKNGIPSNTSIYDYSIGTGDASRSPQMVVHTLGTPGSIAPDFLYAENSTGSINFSVPAHIGIWLATGTTADFLSMYQNGTKEFTFSHGGNFYAAGNYTNSNGTVIPSGATGSTGTGNVVLSASPTVSGTLNYNAATGGTLTVNGFLNQPAISVASAGTPNVASGSYQQGDSLWNGSAPVTESWKFTGFQSTTGLAGISTGTWLFQHPTGFTGAAQFVLATDQVATSGNNYAAPGWAWQSNNWNSSTSVADDWNLAPVLGSGANPTSALTLTHTGSGGTASINFGSFPLTAGTVNGVTLASGGQIVYVGSGTYTTATSDAFTVTGATSSSHCTLTPTNATAAAATVAAYVSSKSANSITVSHVVTTASGGTVDIHCTAN
jgi:hypothetical protein